MPPGPSLPGKGVPDKPKDFKKVIRRLGHYVHREIPLILLAFIMTVAGNMLGLLGPDLSGKAINAMGISPAQVDMATVGYYAAFMLAAYLGSSVFSFLTSRLMIVIAQRIAARMRQDTFNKIVELPLSYIDNHQAGDLVSRISYDIDVINTSLTNDILQIAASVITIIGSLIMMLRISPSLSLIFVVTVPLSIVLTRYRVRKTRPLFSRRSRELGAMNGYVEEILTGQKTIRSYNREEIFTSRFNERNSEATKAYYEADYQGAINGPTVNLINNLSLAMISMFGALLYLAGKLLIGDLSAFVLYSRKFSGPINEIANITGDLQSAASAAERVFTLLDQPSEPADSPGALTLADVRGDVTLEHLRFGYIPGTEIIHDLSLKASKGSLIAIVGPTGAGKTTLINLLMRFYDPQSGIITVDGHNTREITRRSLRRSFAMVLQDTWLFEGSIRDNIAYGRPEASLEEIKAAATAAHMDHFIEAQADGYDTIISDGANNISQGQKQLLTIARAMLLDEPMLILDEATSNVDSRTERQIQDAMNKLMEGRTSFVIAHRLSTIQNADNILVVMNGEIVEQGRHQELLDQNGTYAKLYQAQFL
ncbi:MAG: ABC transporter ATP-binding protein [Clostridiaceae bacterium]|nr:ABC transporter ATP-binding protein [Clostridiaceae bacterium]